MQDFEKLGAFYLGNIYDRAAGKRTDDILLYDSKDLTTHAVCVGMTGSGKTGLCIGLLEEAAIDGIPSIVIDPKGDMGNLLLTFPNLQPSDFLPWVDEAEAARKNMTPAQFAEKTADLWKNGLASWGQDASRIAMLKEKAEMAVYTPGSDAGLPLSIVKSFAAPPEALRADQDAMRDRIMASVSGLLALLGIEADPIQSREHILLSNIFGTVWKAGRDLGLPDLIRNIQDPPFKSVGVFDLESFYSSKDRMALAMRLNNMLASPGFSAWMTGEPLDIQRLLYAASGKPRISILSIAHLNDSERMFFVTMLLNEVISWMRAQPGTSSLRAILYMDEIFGYFPPTANPPSKIPMLTLLKQARAYGLGCVLATQNPVDLDYKGLSNTGTWFIGRLQTERDKMRVLDGLEGASGTAGKAFNRSEMEQVLAGLGQRVFLMNNVHDDAPVLFETRWAMSYLRGPLTRAQIQQLMAPRKEEAKAASPAPVMSASAPVATASAKPVVAPGVTELYMTASKMPVEGSSVVLRPALLANVKMHFTDAKSKTDQWQTRCLLAEIPDEAGMLAWDSSEILAADPQVAKGAPSGAKYADLPAPAGQAASYKAWDKSLKDYVYESIVLNLFQCAALKEVSKPEEEEGDFRGRLAQSAREERDAALDKVNKSYSGKMTTLQNRIRAAEAKIEREKAQYKDQKFKTVLSMGATVLGAMLGRRAASVTTVGRAATTMRSAGRIADQKGDVAYAETNLEALNQQYAALDAEYQAALEKIKAQYDAAAIELQEISIRPKKADISVQRLALCWTPWSVDAQGMTEKLF